MDQKRGGEQRTDHPHLLRPLIRLIETRVHRDWELGHRAGSDQSREGGWKGEQLPSDIGRHLEANPPKGGFPADRLVPASVPRRLPWTFEDAADLVSLPMLFFLSSFSSHSTRGTRLSHDSLGRRPLTPRWIRAFSFFPSAGHLRCRAFHPAMIEVAIPGGNRALCTGCWATLCGTLHLGHLFTSPTPFRTQDSSLRS